MRIATRGSALALAQASWVAERVGGELVEVVTSGDRRRNVDDKREWVAEIEDALLRGEADLAVHSAKDVPVDLAGGLAIVAAPPRADPADVLCGAPSLDALPSGARVGTASLRRRAQVLAVRPDLDVVELRGNVDTRLRKLADGKADAIVLAAAGLARLGRSDAADGVLGIVPAAGQGLLAIEARVGDAAAAAAVQAIRDPEAEAALAAERAVVAGLGADCRSALGVHAQRRADGSASVRAWVGATDGSRWLTDELLAASGPADPAPDLTALGVRLAERLLAAGAKELLHG